MIMSLPLMIEMLGFIVILKLTNFINGQLSLIPLSVTYIPFKITPRPRYELFQPTIEQIAYDPIRHHVYTIGKL